MTSARRQRKLPSPWRLLGIALLLAAVGTEPWSSRAATTEQVVVDRLTGLAVSGFDPVAYYTEHEATLGRETLELSYAGAVWRFRNEGNRAAFAADPHVYMPRFGGYDPMSVARGLSVPGHPEIWAISAQRLYLFSSRQSRAAFLAQPDRAQSIAERNWPDVARTLAL
jgi:hypothetical protein